MENDNLLHAIHQLEEKALADVFDQYYKPIYRYILLYAGHDEQISEDLAAEVFMRLLKKLKEGKGPQKNLQAWLYRVARNVCIDYSRKAFFRKEVALKNDLSTDVNLDELIDKKGRIQEVLDVLQTLPPKQKTALLLKYVEGYENDQIAIILNISRGAVKVLHHRGIHKIKSLLAI